MTLRSWKLLKYIFVFAFLPALLPIPTALAQVDFDGQITAPPVLQTGAPESGNLAAPSIPVPAAGASTPPIETPPAPPPAQPVSPSPAPPAEPVAPPAQQPSAGAAASTRFEDWAVECFGETEKKCQVTHRVLTGDGTQVALVLSLAAVGDGDTANVAIALPLGVALSDGVNIVVGTGYQSKVPVDRCTEIGCLIEGVASDDFLSALRRERSGAMIVHNEQGQPIEVPFSLMGFTAAYANMLEQAEADPG